MAPVPRRLIVLAVLALVMLGACGVDEPRPAAPSASTAATGERAAFEAIVRVTGGAGERDTLPMIVAIHGLGDTPEAFSELFTGFATPARVVVPRAPEPYHGGFGWFPFRSTPEVMEQRAAQLARAITSWRREHPTRGAPLITGFSQGGMLSFAVAVRHPEVIRASFPVSGRLPAALVPARAPSGVSLPPIRAMHGTDDELIPIAPTRAVVAMLRERGFPAEPLREHQGVGHTITPVMQHELHQWLSAALRD